MEPSDPTEASAPGAPKSPGPPGPCSPAGPPPCCALAIAAIIMIARKTTGIFFIGGSPWGSTYDKRDATCRAESARILARRNDAAQRVGMTPHPPLLLRCAQHQGH